MANTEARVGPDLQEILTDAVGFVAFAAERKLQLLSTPWPSGALPPPTSSLLSIASNRALLAAAAPEGLIVASTHAVRAAFKAEATGTGGTIPFEPQLKLPLPMRISQVAFSADENYLVISAEQGGGLAVYHANSLTQANAAPAFELSTNAMPLRAMVPNPAADKSDIFAIVTTSGQLMIANLKTREYMQAVNGPVLAQQVSCVAWSKKGKQLVAGLGDGTCLQMTPEGVIKAIIPRPPPLTNGEFGNALRSYPHAVRPLIGPVSCIAWLETDIFLLVHTPTRFEPGSIPSSAYHLVTRQPPAAFGFQRLPDPCFPGGLTRSPPHQSMLRLNNFKPALEDMLFVASTGSTDLGVFTRSSTPMSQELPAEQIVNLFTTTVISDDSRRAQMPLTEDMLDTSPIGIALDLSSIEPVFRPLPMEGIDETTTPLPALMVLNNEGVLAAWWVVYADAVRQGVAYPGLSVVSGGKQPEALLQQLHPRPAGSAFGSVQPSHSAFGQPALPQPAASVHAFGSPAVPGVPASPWGAPPAAATGMASGPRFGTPTALGGGSTFGNASALGAKVSVWSRPAAGVAPAGGLASPTSGGAFGAYAQQGGFATVLDPNKKPPSVLTASANPGSPPAAFGAAGNNDTVFKPATGHDASQGAFGIATAGFVLPSTFQPDATSRAHPSDTMDALEEDGEFPASADVARALFGSAPGIQEADMDADEGDEDDRSLPLLVPMPSDPSSTTTGPAVGLASFSAKAAAPTTGSILDLPVPLPSTTPLATPSVARQTKENDGPPALSSTPSRGPAPAPPATGSSTPLGAITNQASSSGTPRAPPPAPSAVGTPEARSTSARPTFTPHDRTSDDDDGWEKTGHDAAGPGQPSWGSHRSEQEKGMAPEPSPLGESFTAIAQPSSHGGTAARPPPLFGEVERSTGFLPALPRPTRTTPDSARSPSPVRTAAAAALDAFQRPGTVRSSSAPGGLAKMVFHKSSARGAGGRESSLRHVSRADSPEEEQAEEDEEEAEEVEEEEEDEEEGEESETDADADADADGSEAADDDAEDNALYAELASDGRGAGTRTRTRTRGGLRPFVAHRDYVRRVRKDGIDGQMERLYRDIHSMVDTVAVNARHLTSFLQSHGDDDGESATGAAANPRPGRDRDDLESADGWLLVETGQLAALEDGIEADLEAGKLRQVAAKSQRCQDLSGELGKLRTLRDHLRNRLYADTDPAQIAAAHAAPPSTEQVLRQHELRGALAIVQERMAHTEESISLLRAQLASSSSSSAGHEQAPATGTPTVEAVVTTIMKMTAMAEQRSADVAVLESQMRQLGMVLVDDDDDEPGVAERGGRTSMGMAMAMSRGAGGDGFATPPPASHLTKSSTGGAAGGKSVNVSRFARSFASSTSTTTTMNGAAEGGGGGGGGGRMSVRASRPSDLSSSSSSSPAAAAAAAAAPNPHARLDHWRQRASNRQQLSAAIRSACAKVGARVQGMPLDE
ncbi:MAG: hypothetical protein M1826_001032 [Phylliscum demangeonii]|nr:MAG: hypothetical protein M1826_001032 [Phylliscum demangeonii]